MAEVTITVKKVENKQTIPEMKATYGDTLSMAKDSDGKTLSDYNDTYGEWTWEDGNDTSVGNATTHTYTAKYTPKAEYAVNYAGRTGVEVTVIVAKKAIVLPTLTKTSFVYNGSVQKPEIPVSDDYTVAWADENRKNVGSYTVTLTLTDSNYAWSGTGTGASVSGLDATYTYAITKATLTVTENKVQTATYGDKVVEKLTLPVSTFNGNKVGTWAWRNVTAETTVGDCANKHYFEAKCTLTGNDAINFNSVSIVTVEVTVNKATPTLTVTDNCHKTYDGNAFAFAEGDISISHDKTEISYQYKLADSTEEAQSGLPTNAGTYTVTVTLSGSANYEGTSTTVTVIIDKATPTLTVKNNCSKTYDGNAFAFAEGDITPSHDETAEISYQYKLADSTEEAQSGLPTNAGRYTVTVFLGESANYKGTFTTVTVAITKAQVTTSITNNNRVYTGEELSETISVQATTTIFVDLAYKVKLDGTVVKENAKADPMTVTQSLADTYNYTVELVDTDNFELESTAALTFTIAKSQLKATVTNGSFTFDNTAHTATYQVVSTNGGATAGYKMVDGDSNAATNAGTHKFHLTLTDTDNYAWEGMAETTVELSFTINTAQAKDIHLSDVSITGWTFGDTANSPSATAASFVTVQYRYEQYVNGAWMATTTVVNAGDYRVQAYVVADGDNYVGVASAWKEFTIAKKSVSGIEKLNGFVYNGTAVTPTVGEGYTMTFTKNDESVSEAKDVGVYTVTITAGDNYVLDSSVVSNYDFEITPAVVTVQVTSEPFAYNGSKHSATFAFSPNEEDGKIPESGEYTVNGNEGTNAGTYNFTVELNGNYILEDGTRLQALNFEIQKATWNQSDLENVLADKQNFSIDWYPALTLEALNITLDGYAWSDPTTALTPCGKTAYPVVYTDPSGNYNPITLDAWATVQVFKAKVTITTTLKGEAPAYDATKAYKVTDLMNVAISVETGATLTTSDFVWTWSNDSDTITNAGTYSVNVQLTTENSSYYKIDNESLNLATATINKAYAPVPGTISASVGDTLSELTIPKCDYGTWAFKTPDQTLTTTGDQKVDIIFTPDKDYKNNYEQYKTQMTIAVGTTVVDTTITATSDKFINGDITVSVSVKAGSDTLTVGNNYIYTVTHNGTTLATNNAASFTIRDAGTYTFTLIFTVSGGYSWNSADGTVNGITLTKTLVIGKATNEWSKEPAISVADITYGKAYEATATAKYGTVAITYATKAADGTWSDYSTTKPTNAGTHKVKFFVEGTDNYTELSKEIEYTIGKATPEITSIKTTYDLTWYEGLKLGNITIEDTTATPAGGTFAWAEPDTALDATTYKFDVVYTPADTANYNTVSKEVTINVAPKGIKAPTASADLTYTGSTQTATVTDVEAEGNRPYTIVNNGGKNVGNYTVTVTLQANYAWTNVSGWTQTDNELTYTYTIKQATNSATLSMSGWTYGDTANSPAISDRTFSDTTPEYQYSTDNFATHTTVRPTNAGDYSVRAVIPAYVVNGATNYPEFTTIAVDFTIEQATVTASLTKNSFEYTAQEIDVTEYLSISSNPTTTMAKVTDYTLGNQKNTVVGSYTLTITLSGNYKFADGSATLELDYSITKKANGWVSGSTPKFSKTEWTYGDTPTAELTMPELISTSIDAAAGLQAVVTYKNTTTNDTYTELSNAMNAGSYVIEIFVAGNKNWNDFTDDTLTFTINQKPVDNIVQTKFVSEDLTATEEKPIVVVAQDTTVGGQTFASVYAKEFNEAPQAPIQSNDYYDVTYTKATMARARSITIDGDGMVNGIPTAAGTYIITLRIKSDKLDNYKWLESLYNSGRWTWIDDNTLQGIFVINPKVVGADDITALNNAATSTYTYTGENQLPTLTAEPKGYVITKSATETGDVFGVSAGTHTVTLTPTSANFVLADGYNASGYTFTINKAKVVTSITNNNHVYTGADLSETISVTAENRITVKYKVNGGEERTGDYEVTETDAGTYTYAITLVDTTNFELTAGSELTFTINKETVEAKAGWNSAFTYTGKPAALSYTVQTVNGKITLKAGTDYTTNDVETNASDSDYNLEIKLENSNFTFIGGDTATLTYSIKKATATITLTLTNYTWQYGQYNAEANKLEATVTKSFTDSVAVAYKYATNSNGTGIIENFAPNTQNAGTYYVQAYAAGTDNYDVTASAWTEFIITEQVISSITKIEGDFTYDGTAKATAASGTGYTMTFTKGGVEYSEAVDAGEYTVTITAATNYKLASTVANNYTFTIKPATVTLNVPTTSFEYTGSPITVGVVVKAGETKLTAGTDYTVSDNVQTNANANGESYTLTVTLNDNYTFGTSNVATKSYTILPSSNYTASVTNPAPMEWDANRKLGDITLTTSSDINGTFTYDTNASLNYIGTQSFTVTFTPENTNYATKEDLTVTVTITKATASILNVSETYSINYGEELPTINEYANHEEAEITRSYARELADGTYEPVNSLTNADAGTYRIIFSLVETDHYKATSTTTTVVIKPLQNGWSGDNPYISKDSWEYNETAGTLTISGLLDNEAVITVEYYKGAEKVATVTENLSIIPVTSNIPVTAAGSYRVEIVVEDTTNYKGFIYGDDEAEKLTFTIQSNGLETPTLSCTDKNFKEEEESNGLSYTGLTYKGSAYTITITIPENQATKITVDGAEITGSTFELTNADTHTIVFTAAEGSTWKASGTTELTITVTIAKANNTLTDIKVNDEIVSGDSYTATYSGSAYAATATAKYGTVKVEYAVYGSNVYSETAPTNAGTYTIKLSVTGTTNYNDLEKTITLTIKKKKITPSNVKVNYTDDSNVLIDGAATTTNGTKYYYENLMPKLSEIISYNVTGVNGELAVNPDFAMNTDAELSNATTTDGVMLGTKTVTVTFTLKNDADKVNYEIVYPKAADGSSLNYYPVTVMLKGVAYIGDTYYGTIENAVTYANEKGGGTVWVVPDTSGKVIIENTCTIGAKVTLCLPYDGTTYFDNYSATNTLGFADASKTSVTNNRKSLVTLDANTTLIVNGTLIIGGMLGSAGQGLAGHTSGLYAELRMVGNAKIASIGTINCYGYIKEVKKNGDTYQYVQDGESQVIATSGTVYLPFVVYDYKGGSSTVGVYVDGSLTQSNPTGRICPLNEFDTPNIQAELTVTSNGTLIGMADLYTGKTSYTEAQHNTTEVRLIADSNAIINLNTANSKAIVKYIPKTAGLTSTEKGNKENTQGGVTYLTLIGGAKLGTMNMHISLGKVIIFDLAYDISTKNVFFPVSWKYQVTLDDCDNDVTNNNSIYTITQKVKFMSGSTLTVKEGATLNLDSGAQVIIYPESLQVGTNDLCIKEDNIYQATSGAGSYHYPTKKAAEILVYGTMNINASAAFGGIITAKSANAVLNVNSSATLQGIQSEEGYGTADISGFTSACVVTDVIVANFQALSYTKVKAGATGDQYFTTAGTYYGAQCSDGTYAWVSATEDLYLKNFQFSIVKDGTFTELTDLTGVTNNVATQVFTYDQTTALLGATYTVDGATYVFKGWYFEDGTVAEADRVQTIIFKNDCNKTLYGVFEKIDTILTVKFEDDTITVSDMTIGKPEDFSPMTETFDSYADINNDYMNEQLLYLAGWYISTDVNKTLIDTNNRLSLSDFTLSADGTTGTITLKALWKPKHIVTVNANKPEDANDTVKAVADSTTFYLNPEQFTIFARNPHAYMDDSKIALYQAMLALKTNVNANYYITEFTNSIADTFSSGAITTLSGAWTKKCTVKIEYSNAKEITVSGTPINSSLTTLFVVFNETITIEASSNKEGSPGGWFGIGKVESRIRIKVDGTVMEEVNVGTSRLASISYRLTVAQESTTIKLEGQY